MDVRDRGMLYYRLLREDVGLAQKVVCGQTHFVREKNTVLPRVSWWVWSFTVLYLIPVMIFTQYTSVELVHRT